MYTFPLPQCPNGPMPQSLSAPMLQMPQRPNASVPYGHLATCPHAQMHTCESHTRRYAHAPTCARAERRIRQESHVSLREHMSRCPGISMPHAACPLPYGLESPSTQCLSALAPQCLSAPAPQRPIAPVSPTLPHRACPNANLAYLHLGARVRCVCVVVVVVVVCLRSHGAPSRYLVRRRPYRVECTGSLPTSEVKRRRAQLVLGWGTAWEHFRVLSAFRLCLTCAIAVSDAWMVGIGFRVGRRLRRAAYGVRRLPASTCGVNVLCEFL